MDEKELQALKLNEGEIPSDILAKANMPLFVKGEEVDMDEIELLAELLNIH